MSLRRQFSLALLALFLAVLLVIMLVAVSGTRRYLEQQLGSHAQDAATALSVTLGQSLGKGDLVLAEANVASLFDRGYFKRIDVLAPDRHPILKREMAQRIEGVPAWFVALFPISAPAGEAFVASGWKQLGKVLVVSQPTFAYQYLWRTTEQLFAWIVGLCAAALALFQVLLYFILKPLRAIEKTAMDVQAKRFEQIAQRPRAPELAAVVTAMNQMSRRVGEMLDGETAKVQALHKQAYQDDMTGLANRRALELRLAELLQGEHQFSLAAVVGVEMDDMRLLSQTYGYAADERIMRVVADSAQAVFSSAPVTILARSNEFSFSFVVADLTHAQVTDLATELRRRVMVQLADDVPAQMVAINTAVAFFHQQEHRSDVFARADLALESARQYERNGFAVLGDQPDENASLGSSGWRALIKTALLENRWRLLHQPVFSLGLPQTVLQMECMARLVDSHGELVPASNFMPMAARHHLMPEVDRAMVTLALIYLKEQVQESSAVAINLSPQSMVDVDFMDWLAARLASVGADARRLTFEVSEFGALRNVGQTMRVRDLVRKHGGKFGIDHFGLDPQAFKLLREIAPDYVKLTGALTADIETVESEREMLQSFVTLAHSLDVMVIAQQVERIEQIAVLASAQVDAGQGYYFGAPQ